MNEENDDIQVLKGRLLLLVGAWLDQKEVGFHYIDAKGELTFDRRVKVTGFDMRYLADIRVWGTDETRDNEIRQFMFKNMQNIELIDPNEQ